MTKMMNRSLAVLMALVMCASMFFGLSFPAQATTVEYKYSTDGNSYIYNWGVRGTVAEFLSPNAETFYSENNTSLSALMALDGSSSESDVPSSDLYSALYNLMSSNHETMTSYGDTRYLYMYTDCEQSNTSNLSLFYSGSTVLSTWDNGVTFNREHIWPDSRGTSTSDVTNNTTSRETDIIMIRPTTVSNNSSRGNTAYGESSGFLNPYTHSFPDAKEENIDVRGDAARTILYVYVRYGNDPTYSDGALDYMWGSNGVIESKEILLKWIEEDPVDTWELGRNDSVEAITGTRNVFVDYPELAFDLFEEDIPAHQTPSGIANNGTGTDSGDGGDSGDTGDTDTTYTSDRYVKVTETPTDSDGNVDWSGDYLIVYEEGSVALDGSRTTSEPKLDAASNTIAVTITDNEIIADTATNAAKFTIATVDGGYSIKSASGYYIGNNSDSNALTASTSTVYTNTISLVDGSAHIVGSAGAVLRYNKATGNLRFRYFKASTYTNQQPVALYKFVEGTAPTYKIEAMPNDDTMGTVTVSGNTIFAYPTSDKYEVIDHTVISGEVTSVIHEGNKFTVTATSDAVIQINFALREENTIDFYQLGKLVESDTEYNGNQAKLPNHLGNVPMGWSFVGWVDSPVTETTDKPTTIYTAGSDYTVTENTALYALYSRSEESTDGDTAIKQYVKVTADQTDWSGDYLIVYEDGNVAFDGGLTTLDAVSNTISVTITNGTIPSDDTENAAAFTIAAIDGGYTVQSASGYYIGQTSNANGLQAKADTTYVNTISINDDSTVNLVSGGAYLRYNAASNQNRFRYYKSSTYTGQKAINLYKLEQVTGAVTTTHYYFTDGIVVDNETDGYYVKVTADQADWSGDYLIVSQDKDGNNVVFDGSRATLDEPYNVISNVIINGNAIKATDSLDAAKFTIEKSDTDYTVKTNSTPAYYIGQTSNDNGLLSDTSTAHVNTILFNEDGSVNIIGSGGAYLRFNSDNGMDYYRFRYYKSSTYTGQQSITLYKYIPFEGFVTGAQVNVGSDISVNYYVSFENTDSTFDNGLIETRFTIGKSEPLTVGEYTVVDSEYVFNFEGISPQRMTDNIKAEILYDGAVIGIKDVYSIRENALNLLALDTTTASQKQFIVDMLYYGAAAQEYRGYKNNEESLATYGLSEVTTLTQSTSFPTDSEIETATDKISITNPAGDIYFKSATVWFDSVNKLIIKLNTSIADSENLTLRVTVDGVQQDVDFDGTVCTTQGILATDFDKVYTFELCDGDSVIQTLSYSINAYTYSKSGSSNEKMAKLAKALYYLGVSAENYNK